MAQCKGLKQRFFRSVKDLPLSTGTACQGLFLAIVERYGLRSVIIVNNGNIEKEKTKGRWFGPRKETMENEITQHTSYKNLR